MMLSMLLTFLLTFPCIESLLSTLSLQSLNITYPSYSYRGAAAIYNKTLYSWNGYECNISNYSQCTMSNQIDNTTNILHTLDISALSLTSSIGTRTINESHMSSQWQTFPSIDPIFVDPSIGNWPSMRTGTSTSSYTASSHYGWVIFPSGGDYRTKIALKFDLNLKQFVNTSEYEAYIPSPQRWSGSCNANDGIHIYAINGRGTQNSDNTNNVWIYHIENNIWTQGSDHPETLFEPSCTIINGILYSLGGQDSAGPLSRIKAIYGYDTGSDTWINSKNKIGDLIQARHHGISVSHPNNWIITVGGRGTNDLHTDIIELFDPVSGQSFDTQMRYSLQGMYHAKYKYDSQTEILFLWAGEYNPNNLHVSIHNEIKYIILSKYDAIYPTTSPSTAPTNTPTISPSISPTINTNNPTYIPTYIPTNMPTSNPTPSPTFNPTLSPTFSPSLSPTYFPTFNPSNSPIYLNEGQVTDFQTTGFEEEKSANIIVNIVENDKWMVIAIVVIIFIILCFIGCMYWIYNRYNYKKMKRDINVMNVNQTQKKTSDQIEIELVNTEKMEGVTTDTISKVVPDENSDSESKDQLYEQTTKGVTTKGDNNTANPSLNTSISEEMYVETKGNEEIESPGSNDNLLDENNETNNEHNSDSEDMVEMYDNKNGTTKGQ
eukprot:180799_1